jgi:hypothetical protein
LIIRNIQIIKPVQSGFIILMPPHPALSKGEGEYKKKS